MHRFLTVSTVTAAAAFALTGCGGSPPKPSKPVTVTNTVTASATAGAPAETAPGTRTWTMPDLVGHNLQDAQDEIQRITDNAIFYTTSTDLTGQARHQVLDRNWQVCSSTPPPGTTIDKDSKIDFGVVRIDGETCP